MEIYSKNGNLPEYSNAGDSGMDLRADINIKTTLKPNERKLIPTGIHLNMTEHKREFSDSYSYLEAQVRPKSGQSIKKGLIAVLGTVDNNYLGEVKVIAHNISDETIEIAPNEKIAQLVFAWAHVPKSYQVLAFPPQTKTERGDKGFGSTGIL